MAGLSAHPLLRWLAPSWPDEARRIIQEPLFRALLAGQELRGRCLNAGCGEGLYAALIEGCDQVGEVFHLDLHAPRRLLPLGGKRRAVLQGSLTALPLRDGSCGSCLCSEVLEHVPEDAAALRELARVIERGGVLLISVPTPPAPFDPAHVREGYCAEELAALLRAAGFEVIAHSHGFHWWMRLYYRLWCWQHRCLGGGRLSFAPRFLTRAAAHLDRRTRWGRPWDLALLARRA